MVKIYSLDIFSWARNWPSAKFDGLSNLEHFLFEHAQNEKNYGNTSILSSFYTRLFICLLLPSVCDFGSCYVYNLMLQMVTHYSLYCVLLIATLSCKIPNFQ